ncbi:MAG: 1-acyl-sn-glycerol-3-phosphate acyltransferase [Candidatus Omnitrophota bacterium]
MPVFVRWLSLPFIRREIRRNFGGSLRLCISGGARLDPMAAKNLTKWGFEIIEGYGLTETSPIVTLSLPRKGRKFGSVGRPIPGVEVKIEQADKRDKSRIGQILVRGANVMQGYFKQPELTASIIKDGWFATGDLGYLDRDGYVYITGRQKEVIVLSSGKTIYPEDLEAYYSQSPYIKEICILERSEEKFQHLVESLYAVVVPDLDYFRRQNALNIQVKIRWELENLAKALPAYQHIMGFTLTKERFSRTTLGKIKRFALKDKYLRKPVLAPDVEKAALSKEDIEILQHEHAKKIIHYLSTVLKRPVYLDSHLEIDLGIDSLAQVELTLGMEELLAVKIPDGFLVNIATVKELILKITDKPLLLEKAPQGAGGSKDWHQILRQVPQGFAAVQPSPGILCGLLIRLFRNLFLFIFRLFWRLRIEGKEHLSSGGGPYLICPNHASFLDGLVIFASLPLKSALNAYFLGYSDIFEHPLLKWVLKLGRIIPIDPNIHLAEAMQAVSFVLSKNKIVCIFPEGHRSIDERIAEFKKGAGILIKELDIPVVPVYIKGSHYSWPRGTRFPRPCPLKVIFGRPVSADKLLKKSAGKETGTDEYIVITKALREEVLKLRC